jgi:hypothetical protein
MEKQYSKTKLYQKKNYDIEKIKINKKIPDSQLKKFSYYPSQNSKNSLNYLTSFENPIEQSDFSKKSNLTKITINTNTHNNSHSDNFNNNIKFSPNKINNRLNTDFNVENINKNNYNHKLIQSVFKNLGIHDIYLEKLYLNKIDFIDLLDLNKEDLKEMNIPIGPRNRLLNFIHFFIIFKENFQIKSIDLKTLDFFFSNEGYGYSSINKKNPISEKIYSMNSPTINIKTKYNNNFSTNVDNNILIKQEIKKYLYNNANNLTISLNKTPYNRKKSNLKKERNKLYNISKYNTESARNNKNEKYNKNIFTIDTSSNIEHAISHRNNNNYDINIDDFQNLILKNQNKYKPNSRIKFTPGSHYSKNKKQFINVDLKNNKSNSKGKQKNSSQQKLQKSIHSFNEEGLNLLEKMKKDLNNKLQSYTKSIGEKKLLLKLLEGSNEYYEN